MRVWWKTAFRLCRMLLLALANSPSEQGRSRAFRRRRCAGLNPNLLKFRLSGRQRYRRRSLRLSRIKTQMSQTRKSQDCGRSFGETDDVIARQPFAALAVRAETPQTAAEELAGIPSDEPAVGDLLNGTRAFDSGLTIARTNRTGQNGLMVLPPIQTNLDRVFGLLDFSLAPGTTGALQNRFADFRIRVKNPIVGKRGNSRFILLCFCLRRDGKPGPRSGNYQYKNYRQKFHLLN